MKISDLVVLSAKNLIRRKGRTALTVIGVVVGTCAVIVMISLGIAQSQAQEEMIKSFNDLTQIKVYSYGMSTGKGAPPALTDEALAEFKKLDHVEAVTPEYNSWETQGTIYAGNNNRYSATYSNATGVYPEALEPMGFTLEEGGWISPTENYGKDKIPVLITEGTAYNFQDTRKSQNSSSRYRYYGQTDANGEQVAPFFDINKAKLRLVLTDGDPDVPKTKEYELVVVGKLAPNISKGYWSQTGIIFRVSDMKLIDKAYRDLTKTTSTTQGSYNEVTVKVDSIDNVQAVNDILEEQGFTPNARISELNELKKSVAKSQMILGGLAAISLLVAALNIANTMTMAIYERTREIGVMKVLGCELGQIRAMFLLESGFIGFLGGVVGSVISLGISFIMNNFSAILSALGVAANGDMSGGMSGMMGSMMSGGMYYGGDTTGTAISVVPPWLVLMALAFATLIGLLSGIAPAGRAVKISALEAIRHD